MTDGLCSRKEQFCNNGFGLSFAFSTIVHVDFIGYSFVVCICDG